MTDGPAMGRAMETGCGAALDIQHALTIKPLPAGAVAVETDPATAQGVLVSSPRHDLPGLGMVPVRLAHLADDREPTRWGLPALHADGHGVAGQKLTLINQHQLTTAAVQHQLSAGAPDHPFR